MTGLIRFNGKKIFAAAVAMMLTFSEVPALYKSEAGIVAAAVTGEYKTWKQFDSRWGDMHLGPSEDTMRKSGCVTTSVAILLVKEGFFDETNFNPGIFCKLAGENNGFDKDGIFYWNTVTKIAPGFKFDSTQYVYGSTIEERAAEIKSYLDSGYSIIADVNYCGHWVVIDRVENGVVYDIDPGGYRSENMFEQYDFKGNTRLKLFRVDGRPAKLPEQIVVPQEPEYSTGDYIITETEELNVRKGPSTSTERIGGLLKGTRVNVSEITGCWGKFNFNGADAWICLDYGTKVEPVEVPETKPSYDTGSYIVDETINYRENAGIENKTFGLIPPGTKLNVYEIKENWGRTKYNGRDAWICLDYTSFIASEYVPEITEAPVTTLPQVTTTTAAQTTVTTTTTTTSVTTTIVTTTEPVTTTTAETTVDSLIAATKKAVWYKTTDALNFRTGPGTENEVIEVLRKGTSVRVSEIKNGWGKISYNGRTGWICLDYAVPKDNVPDLSEPPVQTVSEAVTTTVLLTGNVNHTMMVPAVSVTEVSTSKDNSGILKGDIDRNGHVNIIDFIKLKNIFSGEAGETDHIPEEADVNGDGSITAIDLMMLGRLFMNENK